MFPVAIVPLSFRKPSTRFRRLRFPMVGWQQMHRDQNHFDYISNEP